LKACAVYQLLFDYFRDVKKRRQRTGKAVTNLLEELVQDSRLSNLETSRLDGSVIDPQDHIDILHRLCPDIGKFLDLGSSILDLFIVEFEVELFDSRLDGVPSC